LNAFKDDCQQQRLLQKEAEKRGAENKASGMALCSQPISIIIISISKVRSFGGVAGGRISIKRKERGRQGEKETGRTAPASDNRGSNPPLTT